MGEKAGPLQTLDGVIMLSPDGRPATGVFPENVWVVMGEQGDTVEDFFGPSADILTAELQEGVSSDGTFYCVGFDSRKDRMVMNGGGAFPVYVSGLLRCHRKGLQK